MEAGGLIMTVGEGEDGFLNWSPPFDELFEDLRVILSDADEFDLELPLERLLPKGLTRRNELLNALKAFSGEQSLSEIFEALSTEASMDREFYDSDSPGSSAIWMMATIPSGYLQNAVTTFQDVLSVIKGFWSASGNEQIVFEARTRQREGEKLRAEEKALELRQQEQRKEEEEARRWKRATEMMSADIQAFISSGAGEYRQFERALVAPAGECFILVKNTHSYLFDNWVDWDRLSSQLQSAGVYCVEVIETYPAGTLRIPIYAAPQRSYVSGWRQEKSLMVGADGRLCEDAVTTRSEYNRLLGCS
jgi:hypothetical protein